MCRFLVPDGVFPDYRAVTPALLAARGLRGIIFDIDNTLAPYEVAEPDAALLAYFDALRAAGVRMAFVSNNDSARVSRFNRALALPAYPRAHKPRRGALRRGPFFGLRRRARRGKINFVWTPECALLGDQIFTDVWAARRMGMVAFLVPPIRDRRDPLTRLKRLLEKPILRAYARRTAKSQKEQENSHADDT